jgi:small subunit ribosomal protein S7
MAKKKFTASEQTLKPDGRFQSALVAKFINNLMLAGKKSTAERVFYDAMDFVASKVKEDDPLQVFEAAVGNVKPKVEVRSKRVGGQTYQVPHEVPRKRQQSLAIRWIIEACREKKGRPMAVKLGEELVAAYRKEGTAYTRRDNVHRMAEANKAFAHFARW